MLSSTSTPNTVLPRTAVPRMVFPDALRAIAALVVILPHSVGVFAYFPSPTITTREMIRFSAWGIYGVQIFFVLSGFVICYTFRHQRVTPRFTAVFALRRSVRLDPPYWCAMALALLFCFLRSKTSGVHFPTTKSIIAHLFYLQNILKLDEMNAAFWTLCIEVQLYLVFCLFMMIAQSIELRLRLSVAVLGALCFCASLSWPAGLAPRTAGWFPEWWYAFLAGAIVWWATDNKLRLSPALFCLTLLGIVAVTRKNVAADVVFATAVALLICARCDGLYRWLYYRPLQLLGRWSYCIYLVHIPIAGTILALLTRGKPRHEFWGFLSLASIYVLSIITAAVLHRFVELPSLRWSQSLKSLHRREPEIIQVEDPQPEHSSQDGLSTVGGFRDK